MKGLELFGVGFATELRPNIREHVQIELHFCVGFYFFEENVDICIVNVPHRFYNFF